MRGVDLSDPSFDKYESLYIDNIPENKIKIRGNEMTGETPLSSPIDLKSKRFCFDLQLMIYLTTAVNQKLLISACQSMMLIYSGHAIPVQLFILENS